MSTECPERKGGKAKQKEGSTPVNRGRRSEEKSNAEKFSDQRPCGRRQKKPRGEQNNAVRPTDQHRGTKEKRTGVRRKQEDTYAWGLFKATLKNPALLYLTLLRQRKAKELQKSRLRSESGTAQWAQRLQNYLQPKENVSSRDVKQDAGNGVRNRKKSIYLHAEYMYVERGSGQIPTSGVLVPTNSRIREGRLEEKKSPAAQR